MTLAPPGGTYDTGTSVQLTAVAAAGYRFDQLDGRSDGFYESCEHQYDGQQVCDGCVHTDLYVDGSEFTGCWGVSVTGGTSRGLLIPGHRCS